MPLTELRNRNSTTELNVNPEYNDISHLVSGSPVLGGFTIQQPTMLNIKTKVQSRDLQTEQPIPTKTNSLEAQPSDSPDPFSSEE